LSEAISVPSNYLEFVGVISRVKVHKTKTGEDMAFVTCEDEYDNIDGVIFPSIYNRIKIEPGKVYLIKGKLDNKKQKLSIIIDEVKIIKE